MPESDPVQFPLLGFYRVQPDHPGFAIPVFGGQDTFWVQELDGGGRVAAFSPCELEVQQLLPASSQRVHHPSGIEHADDALYAFQMPDGSVEVGSREQLRVILRRVLPGLSERPFLGLEVAEFIGDEVLVREAHVRTQVLLRRTRESPAEPVFEEAISDASLGGQEPLESMLNSLANEVAAVIATSERPALARSQFDAALRDKLQGVAEYHPPRRREPFQPDIEFDRFKERLVLALFLAHQDPRLDAPIRRAANEAAAMAWTTPYPMLVLPELLKEMARRAIDWETQKGRVQAAHDKPATNTALS